mmetsp:Transcript_16119/g.30379  ORF Transcript_16119/g.30379 Transcript_16119/m.30379 type:complete len:329 (-) Transcript_16119:333-1319(-)
MVVPSNPALSDSFTDFHNLIEAINAARRVARDFVTGSHLERMDDGDMADMDDEQHHHPGSSHATTTPWSVSVNCAHLHPHYGTTKTPEQVLEELKAEEAAGEVDVNYQKFQEQRMMARRSPYPTVVLEVCARPPPDFGAAPPPSSPANNKEETKITSEDISKLEALFGQSAHMNHPTKHMTPKEEEDDFYSRIGNSIQELSVVTPMQMAQDYIATHDPHVPPTAAFTTSDAEEPDEAFEFVFTNLSMMAEQAANEDNDDPRYYVVLPHFCAASATSLEKFCTQIQTICHATTELRGRLAAVECFHPEHILPTHRAPISVVALQWKPKK